MNKPDFTVEDAEELGERIGIDWETVKYTPKDLRTGLFVELEHGHHDPMTNVTNDDPLMTAKIALAHLNEFPDYYTRLAKMEGEASDYWRDRKDKGDDRTANDEEEDDSPGS